MHIKYIYVFYIIKAKAQDPQTKLVQYFLCPVIFESFNGKEQKGNYKVLCGRGSIAVMDNLQKKVF